MAEEKRKKVSGPGGGYPYVMMLAGLILLIASSIACSEVDCNDDETLALILSLVAIAVTAIYIFVVARLSGLVNKVFVVGLLVLWAFIAGYLTFSGPFLIPQNGYFAAWLGFLAAAGLFAYNFASSKAVQARLLGQGMPILLLVIGSIVVIVAAVANGCCSDDESVAIAAGSISLILVVLRIVLVGIVNSQIIDLILLVFWLGAGLYLTFELFILASNGFFGVWACMGASLYLAL